MLAWIGVSWTVFWVLHVLITAVVYILSGMTFNPIGLDGDRVGATIVLTLFVALASAIYLVESNRDSRW